MTIYKDNFCMTDDKFKILRNIDSLEQLLKQSQFIGADEDTESVRQSILRSCCFAVYNIENGELAAYAKVNLNIDTANENPYEIILEKHYNGMGIKTWLEEWICVHEEKTSTKRIFGYEKKTNEQRAEELLDLYGFDFENISKAKIRQLIEEELSNFQEGSSEYIRVLCGYLFCIGDETDAELIRRVKYGINMDVGCMIDGDWIEALQNGEDKSEQIKWFIRYYGEV